MQLPETDRAAYLAMATLIAGLVIGGIATFQARAETASARAETAALRSRIHNHLIVTGKGNDASTLAEYGIIRYTGRK